jgi:hypothetical protein
MVRKIASFVVYTVLILTVYFILTSTPKNFVQQLPAKRTESVKMNVSSSPVSYLTVGSYEANDSSR